MGVTVEWKGDQFLAKLTNAVEGVGGGLDKATQHLAAIMTTNIQQSGGTYAPGTPVRDQAPSAPGTPPSSKTGRLAQSMTNAKVGNLRWAAGTNVSYARIQEFGGTINHPGGTAYLTFGGKAVFIKNENAKPGMRRTKPHTITLPPRPFMRPALNNNKDKIGKTFNNRVRAIMEAS